MQKFVIRNIKGETWGYVSYVHNNMPTNQGSPQKPQCTTWLHIQAAEIWEVSLELS
jgi:hypothetical protein